MLDLLLVLPRLPLVDGVEERGKQATRARARPTDLNTDNIMHAEINIANVELDKLRT